jgi:hypothetical protein
MLDAYVALVDASREGTHALVHARTALAQQYVDYVRIQVSVCARSCDAMRVLKLPGVMVYVVHETPCAGLHPVHISGGSLTVCFCASLQDGKATYVCEIYESEDGKPGFKITVSRSTNACLRLDAQLSSQSMLDQG